MLLLFPSLPDLLFLSSSNWPKNCMYSLLLFLSWLVGRVSAAAVDGANVQFGQSAIAHWSLGPSDTYCVSDGFELALYQTGDNVVTVTTVPPSLAQFTTGAWTVKPTITG
ncbi:hypothetical protein EV361DRAFT_283481 [Lentinula raphanica]|nr:hypothetical protein EV361DRAFT_283481 [Lentinula raphanica]